MEIDVKNIKAAYETATESGKTLLAALFPDLSLGQAQTHTDNRPITERIKTFNDACLMTEGKTADEWEQENETDKMDADVLAFLKLRIVCAALNDGWEPQFTEDEWRWYPWFALWTEDELADKDDDWKASRCLRAINDRRTTYAGFAYANSYNAPSTSYARIGSRLCLKSEALANYCGHQFIDLWLDFCLPRK